MCTARRVVVGAAVLTALVTALLGGCGRSPVPPVPGPPATTAQPAPTSATSPAPQPPPTPTPTAPPTAPPTVSGSPVVVIDPGHNGGNAGNPGALRRQVTDGRGGTKACNTTGTETDAGYPEHAFAFDVARRVEKLLTAAGVRVIRTRPDDRGVGPCVDERGRAGEKADADAVVSIHADGSAAGNRGYHVAYSAPPLNAAQTGPAKALAVDLRDAMRRAGFPDSDYIGRDGLSPRSDLTGLNLATRPTALIECANMRNGAEAALVSTPEGRQRYAAAISAGTLAFLAR